MTIETIASGARRAGTRTARFFLVVTLLVSLSTFLLHPAEESFLFGGHGFGTRLAQALFWNSRGILVALTGTTVLAFGAILAVEVALNAALFLLVAGVTLALSTVTHRSLRGPLVVTASCYLFLLFVWPQATYGP